MLKIDIPKMSKILTFVETNNGELAFGYDYPNVFAKLLAKFNKEKLTIQFNGDIYQKLGDVKARKIIDNEKLCLKNWFRKTQSSNHEQFIGKICLT